MLDSVPLGSVTSTLPLVAPEGTVVTIWDGDNDVMAAGVPLKVTLAGAVRFVPRIWMVAPTVAAEGRVLTKGPRPADRRNTVPSFHAPPLAVVP